MIITSSPTMEPSIAPITSIPTVSPSITGEIVSITVSQTVTAELEPSDVRDIENLVDKAYGTGEQDISSSTNALQQNFLTIDEAVTLPHKCLPPLIHNDSGTVRASIDLPFRGF